MVSTFVVLIRAGRGEQEACSAQMDVVPRLPIICFRTRSCLKYCSGLNVSKRVFGVQVFSDPCMIPHRMLGFHLGSSQASIVQPSDRWNNHSSLCSHVASLYIGSQGRAGEREREREREVAWTTPKPCRKKEIKKERERKRDRERERDGAWIPQPSPTPPSPRFDIETVQAGDESAPARAGCILEGPCRKAPRLLEDS